MFLAHDNMMKLHIIIDEGGTVGGERRWVCFEEGVLCVDSSK